MSPDFIMFKKMYQCWKYVSDKLIKFTNLSKELWTSIHTNYVYVYVDLQKFFNLLNLILYPSNSILLFPIPSQIIIYSLKT